MEKVFTLPTATLSKCTTDQIKEYVITCLTEAEAGIRTLGIRSAYQKDNVTLKQIAKMISEIEKGC